MPCNVGLGHGWLHSFSDRLLQEDGVSEELIWLTSEGVRHTFTKNGSLWDTPESLLGTFKQVSSGYVYLEDDGIEHHFQTVAASSAGDDESFVARLSKIVDRNGHGVDVVYANLTAGFIIDKVQDIRSSSRYLDFVNVGTKLTRIDKFSDNQNRGSWSYSHNSDGKQLLSVANPNNEVIRFDYYQTGSAENTISKITETDGSYHAYEYYSNGRTFRVKEGRVVDGNDVEESSHSFSYNQFRNLTEFTDENGNVETYIHQDDGQLVRHIHDDRSRIVTEWGIENASGDVIEGTELLTRSITDETGAIETFEYYLDQTGVDAFKNNRLFQASDKHFPGSSPLLSQYDYSSGGTGFDHIVNPSSITVGVGSVEPRLTSFFYDNRGRLDYNVDSTNRTTSYDYFPDNHSIAHLRGLLESETRLLSTASDGSDAGTTVDTVFTYDVAGLVTSASTNGLPSSTTTYQHTGAPVLTVDATGIQTSFTRDVLGRLTDSTLLGDVSSTADDLTSGFVYDERGRLIESTDALGRATSRQYDRRGNVTSVRPEIEWHWKLPSF